MQHRITRGPISLALASLSFATPLAAESLLQEEIVVTASRVARPLSTIPNTVTLIDQRDLNQQLSVNNDLSTVLGNMIPSFSPSRQKLTSSGETLRGRKPLYLIDGVPQSNPLRNGSRDGHTIDPFMLERVEVIHGANAIHGLGASGGIINLITKRPSDTLEQAVRVDFAGQGEDLGESGTYGVNYSLSNTLDNFDVLASVGYRQSGVGYDADGEIIGFDNTQGDTMDADTLDAFFKGGYNWDDQRLELMVNYFDIEGNNDWLAVDGDQDQDIPTTAIKGEQLGDGVRNEVSTVSLQYLNEDIFGQNLRLQLFRQDFAATYGGSDAGTFQDPAYGPDLFDQSQNNSEKIGAKLTLVKDGAFGLPLNFVYGIDVFEDETWQQLIQTNRAWVPETVYKNYAPYLQAEYSGIERLVLTAGLRHEESKLEVDDFTTLASYGSQFVAGGDPEFSDTLYNAGATYQFTEAWRVFGNYSEGFSMPDVGRVLRGINVPGQSVDDFVDLQPIVTDNIEFGVEFRSESFTAQLSYYDSESDFGQRLAADADGIYSVRRERTEIDGLELSSKWLVTGSDVISLGYAKVGGEYDSDGDDKVDSDLGGANIAPDRINMSWERNWTDAFNTRVQINHLIDRGFDNANGVEVAEFDGYTTVDLMAELAALGGEFRLGLQNLTNEDYYTYYSQTAGNDARNFKGLGRSFSLAYELRF